MTQIINVINTFLTHTHLSLLHLLPRSQSSAVCYSPTHTRGRCLCPCTGYGECYSTAMSPLPALLHPVSPLSAPAGEGKQIYQLSSLQQCMHALQKDSFHANCVCTYLKFWSFVIVCLYLSKNNSTAADERQLISSKRAEGSIMQRDGYLNGTEQLKWSSAPQRHHRLRKIT